MLVDESDRIVMANMHSIAILSDLTDQAEIPPYSVLPMPLREIVRGLRQTLAGRNDGSSHAPLTLDLCVRACELTSGACTYLMLVFERSQRRNPALINLERYRLTPREREVAMLVLQGFSNRTIAGRLSLTEYTVEGYVRRILAKVGVNSRTALVAAILGWESPQNSA